MPDDYAGPEPEGKPRLKALLLGMAAVAVLAVPAWFLLSRESTRQPEMAVERNAPAAAPVPEPARRAADTVAMPSRDSVVPKPAAAPQPAKPVVLEAPADSFTVSRRSDILFRWKLQTDTFTNLYVISLANGKMSWWKGIRPGVREYRLPAGSLWKGNYFWYVGTREYRRILVITD